MAATVLYVSTKESHDILLESRVRITCRGTVTPLMWRADHFYFHTSEAQETSVIQPLHRSWGPVEWAGVATVIGVVATVIGVAVAVYGFFSPTPAETHKAASGTNTSLIAAAPGPFPTNNLFIPKVGQSLAKIAQAADCAVPAGRCVDVRSCLRV
jgi:hypothetical protein